MATRYWRQFFQGGADGTAITSASSEAGGSGDKVDYSSGVGGTTSRVYTVSEYFNGPSGAHVTTTAASAFTFGWTCEKADGEPTSKFRMYYKLESYPDKAIGILQFRGTDGSNDTNRVELQIQPTGRMVLASGSYLEFSSALELFPLDTWVRVELKADINSGTLDYAIYEEDDLVPIFSKSATAIDFQTSVKFFRVFFGKIYTITENSFECFIDSAAWYLGGTTSFFGPFQGDPIIEYSTADVIEVDTTGSSGTVSVSQNSGEEMIITGTAPDFSILRPEMYDRCAFEITATGGSPSTDSETFLVEGKNLNTELVLNSGDASDFENWETV